MTYLRKVIEAFALFRSWLDIVLDIICKHGRNAEWGLVLSAILYSSAYAEPGETLALKIYDKVRLVGMTDARLAWMLAILAGVHAMGLIYNGAVKRTPVWRGACCFGHAVIFGSMGYLTWASSMKATGVLPYSFMVLAFLALTCCRIAGDDRKCLMQQ